MPKEFFLVLMVCAVFLPFAVWGIWDSWLKHRREMVELDNDGRIARLTSEKAELREKVEMLGDRLTVLERIATDPARRTADEIEKLR